MAQTEKNFESLTFTDSGSLATEIATLRTNIQAGNNIVATDLNRIGTLINNLNGHYHTVQDAYQLATFGNNGDRGNYYETKNTSSPDAITSAPTDTASNTTITATRHNALATSVNELRTHYHTIDDRTS
jgi:hypothetical protein